MSTEPTIFASISEEEQMSSKPSIFVSVACLSDHDVVPTVRDMLAKAEHA